MKNWKRRSSLATLVFLLAAGAAVAQNIKYKTLQGKVFGSAEAALSGAIVYLQDSQSNTIRSFISTKDGSYRFGQISPDIDYTVWAKYKEGKSPTKAISSFDSRREITIDLHIKSEK